MSTEREYERLFKLAQKQLQSARTSIESAEVFIDAATDAMAREPDETEAGEFEFPAFGGNGYNGTGRPMPHPSTKALTREMIRSRTAVPADATGVAKPPTPSDTE